MDHTGCLCTAQTTSAKCRNAGYAWQLFHQIKTNECDLLIAIGMRFDDRVTGDVKTYAKQAKVIHIEIDPC